MTGPERWQQPAGCDALTVHLAVTTIGTSIGVGYTPWTILGVMTIMGPWLLAHWEEYHSGIMLYGNGYWGVTEANYLMIALHFFTAAVGPGVPVNCNDYAGSQIPSGSIFSCVHLMSIALLCLAVATVYQC